MSRLPVLALATALACAPGAAHAQHHSWPISAGDHVRVYSAGGEAIRAEGMVEGVKADSVVLLAGGTVLHRTVQLRPNDLFAVRHPRAPGEAARKRSLWGAFLGASLGGIAAPFVASAVDSPLSTGETVGAGVAAGGLLGAAAGAVAGWVMPGHRWQRYRVGAGQGVTPARAVSDLAAVCAASDDLC